MDIYRYFKYRFIDKNLFESLVNGSLYFAHPSKLNDPFDCQVDVRKSAKYAASKVSGVKRDILLTISTLDNFGNDIQQRMMNIGVCSFSLNGEEPILWTHHADEHRGVCLMYEFTEKFLLEEVSEFIGASKIEYGENPLADWMIENIPERDEGDLYDDFTTGLLKQVLIVKASEWGFEEECRIIRENSGPLLIPNKCLKQVCFGMRTTEADMQLVRKIVDRAGYTVVYCQIRKMESDFGIKAVEI